jgi:hypothetical protein
MWTARDDAPVGLIEATDRFLAKLEIGDLPANGVLGRCWNFSGYLNRHGYGHFKVAAIRPSPLLAHVVSYLLFVGSIADGEDVHHSCENEACCWPGHLRKELHGPHVAHHNQDKNRRHKASKADRNRRRGELLRQQATQVRQEVRDGEAFTTYVLPEPRRPNLRARLYSEAGGV